jgi:hypothetical protein
MTTDANEPKLERRKPVRKVWANVHIQDGQGRYEFSMSKTHLRIVQRRRPKARGVTRLVSLSELADNTFGQITMPFMTDISTNQPSREA